MNSWESAVVVLAVVAFVLVAGPGLAAYSLMGLTVIALFLVDRFEQTRFTFLVVCLALALVFFATPSGQLPPSSSFVGPASLMVAFYLNLVMLAALIRKKDASERLTLMGLALAVTVASGMTTHLFPYAAAAALQAVALCQVSRRRRSLPLRLSAIAAMLPGLLLAAGLAIFLKWTDTQLNSLVNIFSGAVSVPARFPASARLQGISNLQGVEGVVLRVFSQDPPDYLVGRCYAEFTGASWEWKSDKRRVHPQARPALAGVPPSFGLFEVQERDYELIDRIEFPAGPYRGATLFAPRDTVLLGAPLQRLNLYRGGVHNLLAKDRFEGTYYLARARKAHYTVPLREGERELFTQLPENLAPIVKAEADRVAGQNEGFPSAALLEQFLQQEFTYGFGYPFRDDGSALEQFLKERPPAHCEFFATALTMMLRTRGIPARYTTGFLVREPSRFGDYQVVRVKHAHAWTEAYFPDLGWVRLDGTPPGSLPEPSPGWALYQGVLEALGYQWAKLKRLFSLSPGELLKKVGQALKQPWFWLTVVTVLIIYYGTKAGWPGWVSQRRSQRLPPKKDDLGRLLSRFEQEMARRNWPRQPHQTLLEWMGSWESGENLSDGDHQKACRFVQLYCQSRYGQEPPEPELEKIHQELSQ